MLRMFSARDLSAAAALTEGAPFNAESLISSNPALSSGTCGSSRLYAVPVNKESSAVTCLKRWMSDSLCLFRVRSSFSSRSGFQVGLYHVLLGHHALVIPREGNAGYLF